MGFAWFGFRFLGADDGAQPKLSVHILMHGGGAVAVPSALQVNPHAAVSVDPVMAVVYFLDLPQNL